MKYLLILSLALLPYDSSEACSNTKSANQIVSESIYEFSSANKLTSDHMYKLYAKLATECEQQEDIFKSIFNSLPKSLRKQLSKTKNVKKLKEQLRATIQKTVIQLGGQRYQVILTDKGNLALMSAQTGDGLYAEFGKNVENFLTDKTDGIVAEGFFGNRDKIRNQNVQKFKMKINGDSLKDYDVTDKDEALKAIGYIKVKGLKVTENYSMSVNGKVEPLLEKMSLKAAIVRCGEQLCVDGQGYLKYDDNGQITVSASVFTGSKNSEIRLGISKTDNDNAVLFSSAKVDQPHGIKLDLTLNGNDDFIKGEAMFGMNNGRRVSGYASFEDNRATEETLASRKGELGASIAISKSTKVTTGGSVTEVQGKRYEAGFLRVTVKSKPPG